LEFYVGIDRLSLIDQLWQIIDAMDFATANLTQDVCDIAVATTDTRYGRAASRSCHFERYDFIQANVDRITLLLVRFQ
jgi:hypothetical protein